MNPKILYFLPVLTVLILLSFSVFAQDEVIGGEILTPEYTCARYDNPEGGFFCGGTCPENQECNSQIGENGIVKCGCVDKPIATRACGSYDFQGSLICGGQCPSGESCSDKFGGCECVDNDLFTGGDIVIGGGTTGGTTTREVDYCLDCGFCKGDDCKKDCVIKLFGNPSYQPLTNKNQALSLIANKNLRYCHGPPDGSKVNNTDLYMLDKTFQPNGDFQQSCSVNDKKKALKFKHKSCREECSSWSECIAFSHGTGKQTRECKWVDCKNVPACLQKVVPEPRTEEKYCRPKFDGTGLIGSPYLGNLTEWRKNQTSYINKTRGSVECEVLGDATDFDGNLAGIVCTYGTCPDGKVCGVRETDEKGFKKTTCGCIDEENTGGFVGEIDREALRKQWLKDQYNRTGTIPACQDTGMAPPNQAPICGGGCESANRKCLTQVFDHNLDEFVPLELANLSHNLDEFNCGCVSTGSTAVRGDWDGTKENIINDIEKHNRRVNDFARDYTKDNNITDCRYLGTVEAKGFPPAPVCSQNPGICAPGTYCNLNATGEPYSCGCQPLVLQKDENTTDSDVSGWRKKSTGNMKAKLGNVSCEQIGWIENLDGTKEIACASGKGVCQSGASCVPQGDECGCEFPVYKDPPIQGPKNPKGGVVWGGWNKTGEVPECGRPIDGVCGGYCPNGQVCGVNATGSKYANKGYELWCGCVDGEPGEWDGTKDDLTKKAKDFKKKQEDNNTNNFDNWVIGESVKSANKSQDLSCYQVAWKENQDGERKMVCSSIAFCPAKKEKNTPLGPTVPVNQNSISVFDEKKGCTVRYDVQRSASGIFSTPKCSCEGPITAPPTIFFNTIEGQVNEEVEIGRKSVDILDGISNLPEIAAENPKEAQRRLDHIISLLINVSQKKIRGEIDIPNDIIIGYINNISSVAQDDSLRALFVEILTKLGEYDEAKKHAFLTRNPDIRQALLIQIATLMQDADPEEANKLFDLVIEMVNISHSPETQLGVALIKIQKGDTEDARITLQRILLDPNATDETKQNARHFLDQISLTQGRGIEIVAELIENVERIEGLQLLYNGVGESKDKYERGLISVDEYAEVLLKYYTRMRQITTSLTETDIQEMFIVLQRLRFFAANEKIKLSDKQRDDLRKLIQRMENFIIFSIDDKVNEKEEFIESLDPDNRSTESLIFGAELIGEFLEKIRATIIIGKSPYQNRASVNNELQNTRNNASNQVNDINREIERIEYEIRKERKKPTNWGMGQVINWMAGLDTTPRDDDKIEELELRVRKLYNKLRLAQARLRIFNDAIRDNFEQRSASELQREYEIEKSIIDGYYSRGNGRWEKGIADKLDSETPNTNLPDIFVSAKGKARKLVNSLKNTQAKMKSAFVAWKIKELNITKEQALVLWWETQEARAQRLENIAQGKIKAKGWFEENFISGSQHLQARLNRIQAERISRFGDIMNNLHLLENDQISKLAALSIMQNIKGEVSATIFDQRFGSRWRRGPVQAWQYWAGTLQENIDLINDDFILSLALGYASRHPNATEIKEYNKDYYDLLVKVGLIDKSVNIGPGEDIPDARDGVIELNLGITNYTSIFFRFNDGRWEWKAPSGFDEYSEWRPVDGEGKVPRMHDKYWDVINSLKGKKYEEGILTLAKALSDQQVGRINVNFPNRIGVFRIPKNLGKGLTSLETNRVFKRSILDDFINPTELVIAVPTVLIPGAIAFKAGEIVQIGVRGFLVRQALKLGVENEVSLIVLGRSIQAVSFAAGAVTEGSVFHGLSSASRGHIDTNLGNYWKIIKFFGVLKIGNLFISPLARVVQRIGTKIGLPEIIVKTGTRGTLLSGEIGALTLADALTENHGGDENQLVIGNIVLKNAAMVIQLSIARRIAGLSPFMGNFLDHEQNKEVQKLIEEQQRLNKEIAEAIDIYKKEVDGDIVIQLPEVVSRELVQKNQKRIEQIKSQILGIYKQNGLDFLIVEDASLDARAKKAIDAIVDPAGAIGRDVNNPLLRAKIVRLLAENKGLEKGELARILNENGVGKREAAGITEIFLEGPFIVSAPKRAHVVEAPESSQLRDILRRLSKTEDVAERKTILEEARGYLEALEPTLRENLQVAEVINAIDAAARERSIDLAVVSLGSLSEANNVNKLLGDVLIEVRNEILKERFGNKYKELTRSKGVLVGITEPVLRHFLEEYHHGKVRELVAQKLREKIEELPAGELKQEAQVALDRLSLAEEGRLEIDTQFDIGDNKIIISPETSEAEGRVGAYRALEEANARNEEADGLKTDAALNPEKGLLFLDSYKVIVYENGKRIFKKVPKDIIIILDAEALLEEFARLRGEIILLLDKAERGELTEAEKQLLREKLENYENELRRIDDIAKRDKRHPEFINDRSAIREDRNNRNNIFDEVRDPAERAERLREAGLEENGLIVFKAGDEIGISYIVVDSEGKVVLDAEGNIIEKFITKDIDNFDAFVQKINALGLSGTKDVVYHRILDMILDTVKDGISNGESDSTIMKKIQKNLAEMTLEFDTNNPKHREYLDGLGISYIEGQRVVVRLDQFKFPLTEKLSKLKEKIIKLREAGNNKKADKIQTLIDKQTPEGGSPPSRIFLGEDGFVSISGSSRTLSPEDNILIVFDQEQNRIGNAKKESKGVLLPEDERVCTPERCVPVDLVNLPRNRYPKAHEVVVREMVSNMPEFEGMTVEVKDRTVIDKGDGVYEWLYNIYIDGELAIQVARSIDHRNKIIKFSSIEVSENFRGKNLAERIYDIELSLFRKLGLDYETFSSVTHPVTTELQVRKTGAVLDKHNMDNPENRNIIIAVLRREAAGFYARGYIFPERHIPELIARMLGEKYTTQDIILSLYTTLKERGVTTGDIVSILRQNFNREEIVEVLRENKILTEGDLASIRHDILNKVRELHEIYQTNPERAAEILNEIKKLEESLGLREDDPIKVKIGEVEAEYRPYKRSVTGVEVEEGLERLEGLIYEKLNEQTESGEEPFIVVRISGRPGSGKSTIAERIGAEGIAATPANKVLVLEADLFDDKVEVIKKILDNRHLLNKPLNKLTDAEFEILMEIVRETPIKGPNEEYFREALRNSENTFLDTYAITRDKSITGIEVIVVEGTYSSSGKNPFVEGVRIEGDINVYVGLPEAERFERIGSRGGQEVETFAENADAENTLHRYGVDREADTADIVIDNSRRERPLKVIEFEVQAGSRVLQEIKNELKQVITERDVARYLAAKNRLRDLFLQGEITNSKYQKMTPIIDGIYKEIISRMDPEEIKLEAGRILDGLKGTSKQKSQLIEGELAELIIGNSQEITLKERFAILKGLFEQEGIDISGALSDLQLLLIVKNRVAGEKFEIDTTKFEQVRNKLGVNRETWNLILEQFRLRLIKEFVNRKKEIPATVETAQVREEVTAPVVEENNLKEYQQANNIRSFLVRSRDFDRDLNELIRDGVLPPELAEIVNQILEKGVLDKRTGRAAVGTERKIIIINYISKYYFNKLQIPLNRELNDILILDKVDPRRIEEVYKKYIILNHLHSTEEIFDKLVNALEKHGYAVDNVIKVAEGEFIVSPLLIDAMHLTLGGLRGPNGFFINRGLNERQKGEMIGKLEAYGLSEVEAIRVIDIFKGDDMVLVSSLAGPSTLFHERFHKLIGDNFFLNNIFVSIPPGIRQAILDYMESVDYRTEIIPEEFWADYFAYRITGEGRILKYLTKEQIEVFENAMENYDRGFGEGVINFFETPEFKELENRVRGDIDPIEYRERYIEAIEGFDVIVPSEIAAAERTAPADTAILDNLNALKDVRDEIKYAVRSKNVAQLLEAKKSLINLFFNLKITQEQYDKASAAVDVILRDLAVAELKKDPGLFSKARQDMLDQLRKEVSFDTILEYLRDAAKENPKLAKEIGEAMKLTDGENVEGEIAFDFLKGKSREKKKGEKILTLYINEEGQPILVGNFFVDGELLTRVEIKEGFGLERVEDENGNPIEVPVIVSGGRTAYVEQDMTVVMDKEGAVKGVYIGRLERSEVKGLKISDKLIYGDGLEIKGLGTDIGERNSGFKPKDGVHRPAEVEIKGEDLEKKLRELIEEQEWEVTEEWIDSTIKNMENPELTENSQVGISAFIPGRFIFSRETTKEGKLYTLYIQKKVRKIIITEKAYQKYLDIVKKGGKNIVDVDGNPVSSEKLVAQIQKNAKEVIIDGVKKYEITGLSNVYNFFKVYDGLSMMWGWEHATSGIFVGMTDEELGDMQTQEMLAKEGFVFLSIVAGDNMNINAENEIGQLPRVLIGAEGDNRILAIAAARRLLLSGKRNKAVKTIKKAAPENWKEDYMEDFFTNAGKNLRALLLTDSGNKLAGYPEKDADWRLRITDMPEVRKFEKGEEVKTRKFMIQRFFEILNVMHVTYGDRGRYLYEGDHLRRFLNNLFKGDIDHVERTMEELKEKYLDSLGKKDGVTTVKTGEFVREAKEVIYEQWIDYVVEESITKMSEPLVDLLERLDEMPESLKRIPVEEILADPEHTIDLIDAFEQLVNDGILDQKYLDLYNSLPGNLEKGTYDTNQKIEKFIIEIENILKNPPVRIPAE